MSVLETNVIDGIYHDDDTVFLMIVDHLYWTDDHLDILSRKLEYYLDGINSPDLYVKYPAAKNRKICIKLILTKALNESSLDALRSLQKLLEARGYNFTFGVFEGKAF